MMKNLIMKKWLNASILIILSLLCFPTLTFGTTIQGGINTNDKLSPYCTVIDKHTKKPVPNAKITIPALGYSAYSDINGHFELKTTVNSQTILAVTKQNYKPYSITLTKYNFLKPFVVEIETITPFDISIESALCHLGDDNYSDASANASQFRSKATGPVFNKKFFIPINVKDKQQYLVFGSIVGIDTALARGMGQNHITTSFASPPSVYLNGQKIAEIQINGDNQKIKLPKHLVKYNQNNVITIKSGRNLMQRAYVDYDDFEFMNLSIQSVDTVKNSHVGFYQ